MSEIYETVKVRSQMAANLWCDQHVKGNGLASAWGVGYPYTEDVTVGMLGNGFGYELQYRAPLKEGYRSRDEVIKRVFVVWGGGSVWPD